MKLSACRATPLFLMLFPVRSSNRHDEQAPSPNEQRLLDSVTKRVRLWKEVEPFYKDADRGPYKSVESRGTESVLNALILSSRDAQSGQFSNDTHTPFRHVGRTANAGEQKGAWLWLAL